MNVSAGKTSKKLVYRCRRYENVKEFPLGVYQNTFWVPKAKQMAVPGL